MIKKLIAKQHRIFFYFVSALTDTMAISAELRTVTTSLIIGHVLLSFLIYEGTNIVEPDNMSGLGMKNHPEEFHFFPFGSITISFPFDDVSV